MKRFLLYLSLALVASVVLAVEEHEEDGHYDDYDYHPDQHHEHPDGEDTHSFDHEVFLGSRNLAGEFQQLEPEEAKDRLLVHASEMDTNKDGSISKEELVAALAKNFLSLDQEEAIERMHDFDTNSDGILDWPEYVKSVYNTDTDSMDALVLNVSAHEDPQVKHTIRTYQNDQMRFKLADQDGDGKLTLVEYTAFSHPYDFEHMLPAEVKQTIEAYDKDGDGKISLQEFLHEDTGSDNPDWKKLEEERFKNELDKNKDGFLDDEEVKSWISPSLQSSAVDEAQHLLSMVDSNSDGLMSQEEMLNAYHILVGSAPDDEDYDHDEL